MKNGLSGIEWQRDSELGQTRDPNTLRANISETAGSRLQMSTNRKRPIVNRMVT